MRRRTTKEFEDGAAARKLLDCEIKMLEVAIADNNFRITQAQQALDIHERNLKDILASRKLLDE